MHYSYLFFYLYLNMKKYFLLFLLSFFLFNAIAFSQEDANQLHENAKTFMRQGDYSNAILILNKARQLDPQNIEITKDLALNYFFQKDNNKALETIKPALDRNDADDQCYQIAGNIYQALNLMDDCEKMYKNGIKKFPDSGPIYHDYGELLWNKQDYTAIKQWEKGIEADPGYSGNYYNACKYYYFSSDKIWSILYGEIFLNMEPLSSITPEIKNILLESYKKLFTDISSVKNKNNFEAAFIDVMHKQSDIALNGITPETLTMIRTRFSLDWFQNYAAKYPFRLFDLQKQLLQSGMFDAYDQWIFGATQNLAAYQSWTGTHSTEYNEFNNFQRGRIFKIPKGQYYK